MSRLVVRGLVQRYNAIRGRLMAGVDPASAPRLRSDVRRLLDAVERECARVGLTPDDLPAPSRAAYRSLAAIDLERLPPPAPVQARPRLRLAGASGVESALGSRMWRAADSRGPGAAGRESLAGEIGHLVTTIERACAAAGGCPADLADGQRRLYAWLRFLSNGGLDGHLAALCLAREAAVRRGRPRLEVHLFHSASLWRYSPDGRGGLLRASEGFVAADARTFDALVGTACGGGGQAETAIVRRFAESRAFIALTAGLDAGCSGDEARPDRSGRGRAHDLDASFDRVNAAMFGGAMTRPRLAWSRVPGTRLLGSFRPAEDLVTLSAVLDDPSVPEVAVDLVLFHELLHRKHGAVFDKGRRHVHTAAFRAEERTFPRREEAEAVIARLTGER